MISFFLSRLAVPLLPKPLKEEISVEIKNLIQGTFFNLTFEHKKKLSSPKQVVAEYLFVLLNTEFYLPHVICLKHRNNILSKMVRSDRWRTPKGFYKHFYLGQNFKDQHELREQRWQDHKDYEINPRQHLREEQNDERLIQLEAQMLEQSTILDKLTGSIYQQSSEEEIHAIQDRILEVRRELEGLWDQQFLIEKEINKEKLNTIKHYA